MIDYIQKILSKYNECLIEVYLEVGVSTRIRCRGNNIEDISKSRNCGGHVNIMKNGYTSFMCFNNIYDLDSHIKCAMKTIGLTQGLSFGEAERDRTTYIEENTADDVFDIKYKADKIKSLNNKINSVKEIDSSVVAYGDSKKEAYYCNSYGSAIKQFKKDLVANFTAVIKKGNYTDILPLSFGSCGDFSVVDAAEEELSNLIDRVRSRFSNTIEIQSGYYPIILDPELGGIFIHEIIGHMLEADSLIENHELLDKININKQLSTEIVTIEDRPDLINLRGSYIFDDEGTRAYGTTLIKNGVLKNYLHSRKTAAQFKAKPTGNARLINYAHKPIVRMSNIVLKEGNTSYEDMINDIEYGIYMMGWKGANTDMDAFTIYPREAYLIREGQVKGGIDNIYIRGDINTFRNIEKLGNKSFTNQGISCSKLNQRSLPVSATAPHIKLSSCFVGGNTK